MDLDNTDETGGAPVGGVLLYLRDDNLHILLLLHHPPITLRVRVQRLPHPGTGHGGLHTRLDLARIVKSTSIVNYSIGTTQPDRISGSFCCCQRFLSCHHLHPEEILFCYVSTLKLYHQKHIFIICITITLFNKVSQQTHSKLLITKYS